MTINPYLLCLSLLIAKLTGVKTQYSYPIKKSASPFSYAVYKNNKVTDGATPSKVEKHTNYQNCVTVCHNNIAWCKSIGVEIQNSTALNCQFFSNFPATFISDGFLFISTIPPSCSFSCSLALNPCGNCECNPSCSGRNRRQHVCNCSRAAGVAKSCQEHFDRGFNKTGIFQISANNILFQTVCEMEKIERQNPALNLYCDLKSNLPVKFAFYEAFTPTFSRQYCVTWCADRKRYDYNIDTVIYSSSGCSCVDYYGFEYDNSYRYYKGSYCHIDTGNTDCELSSTGNNYGMNYKHYFNVPYDLNQCVSFCKNYQLTNPILNGYVASGIVANSWECKCIYGNRGINNVYQYGCSYQIIFPAQTLPNKKGVWIPMMTRFDNWDSFFWKKTIEAYENGFGLLNQQWIGLKKLNEITSSFTTDMRVDFTFKDDVAFSVMYFNIKVDSGENGYAFNYTTYNPKDSLETNPFVGRNTVFKECGWWTTTCSSNTYYPTSTYMIQFGSAKYLKSIQFLLHTL